MFSSPLQQAIDEIVSASSAAEAANRRLVGETLVARIDDFLGELEELHLRGGVRVPEALAARLKYFLDALPPQWPVHFPVRTRIAAVIECLFTLQDHALDLKVRGRRSLRSLDEVIDGVV
ncbi:MAG: hypothetical protein ACYDGR_00390 [Candidatus Dormibacteria bacterium]